jgi:hypothetical protein
MKSRTFKHHVTGRTIIRELNIPGSEIPEYWPPPTREQEAADSAILSGIIWSMLLQPRSEDEQ